MAERDDSISPMTRVPFSPPPSSTPPNNGTQYPPRVSSRLRTQHSASEPLASVNDAGGYSRVPAMATSPSVHESDEFPFHGSPSQVPAPTSALFQSEQTPELPTPVADDDGMPKGRRSVQFARSTADHSRNQSWDNADADDRGKERDKLSSSLMTKLKQLATPIALPGHSRSHSAFAGHAPDHSPHGHLSPADERDGFRFDGGHESEADADAEESAGEGPSRPNRPKQRRKKSSRRWFDDGLQTAPTTPKNPKDQSFFGDSPGLTPTSTVHRPVFLRRGTMSDIPENQRLGVSEDEGRDRLAKESAWTRGLHSARGMSYAGLRRHDRDAEDSGERRPSQLRRLTGFGSATADGQPSPWRIRSERTSSLSAQKWRSIKSTLKMLGTARRAERQVDHTKSAELMAELLAGAPAALFLASMFQRDEHGRKRIPVLLEQIKISITDSSAQSGEKDKIGDRHTILRIELEYGSGLTRMKWVIHRSIKDFAKLHMNYKLAEQQQRLSLSRGKKHPPLPPKRKEKQTASEEKTDQTPAKGPKFPAFPVSAMPYLRGLRAFGLDDEEEDEKEEEAKEADGDASGTDRPGKRQKSSFYLGRRKSSIGSPDPRAEGSGMFSRQPSATAQPGQPPNTKLTSVERQRRKLERYLSQLTAFLIFRADSNRLCKFLELSALGVRLAAEGGYHGKEGFMMIRSAKGVDNRKKWGAAPMVQRYWPKWFLVRHSYVVCVDSPEDMNVYDVFLVDSDFTIDSTSRSGPQKENEKKSEKKSRELASEAKAAATGHHQLRLSNAERKMKLLPKNERQLKQWEDSIRFMMKNTVWADQQRFGSFAPVRRKVYAQWLVDGRDYMWNVSRAISMAKDVIYIHDWWLSPELYMRRPPAISQKWRLDRLLQRKAQEGVKIFVIMYRNINTAIPIDSEYSKFSLLDLHPNVFVQRSPNQIRQNTFFWAHHEKICIVDHTIAFCGGVDLCFGRWDTPQHAVVDDKPTGFELDDDNPKDADHVQLWPGKDYSNPRVLDFYNLDKPYEEMYDREKIPRMPWHDIGMQIVGQPARDLTRHFVQRWNYLLRQRKPSRPTPFLLPPPDFNPADIEALGLDGTCEVQILRSATSWSLGTPNKTEHSIMTAYVQSIANSQHFVYIENQFFITTGEVMNTKIENRIGDALVDRIKRAHQNGEDWRACIIIPLMPGFQNTVDQQEGSSVRLIMTCQYRSICRGEKSIFGRLRAAGIEPDDYIQFFALRSWGALGRNKALVTEQLYIHAKCMIVDDRVAIIGSANINERSMLGSRDSEVAAIVRDTEMLDSYMAGEPYKVGKFPHTLRMRLMREHLGIDVDGITDDELSQSDAYSTTFRSDESTLSSAERLAEQKLTENKHRMQDELARAERLHSFNHDIDWEQENNPHLVPNKKPTTDSRVINNAAHEKDVRGEGPDHMREIENQRPELLHARDSYVDEHGQEHLASDVAPESVSTTPKKSSPQKTRGRSNTATSKATGHLSLPEGYAGLPPSKIPRMDTRALGLTQLSQLPALPICDDTDIGGPPLARTFSGASSHIIHPLLSEMRRPIVSEDCMRDPLSDAFYLDTWQTIAENNTKLFRQVFRCMPDNEVKTWKEYKEYAAYQERFSEAQGTGKSQFRKQQEAPGKTGPPGTGGVAEKLASVAGNTNKNFNCVTEKATGKMGLDGHEPRPPQLGNVGEWAQDQEERSQSAPGANGAITNEKLQVPVGAEPADDAVVSPVAGNLPTEKDWEKFPAAAPGMPDTENGIANQSTPSATDTGDGVPRARQITITEPVDHPFAERARHQTFSTTAGSRRGRRRGTTKSSARAFTADEAAMLSREDSRQLMELVQGHLVLWPYDWLEHEETSGWLYAVDQLAPLEIYT